jgi:glycosyltransferase involved in cell wall biosynthesis
VRILIISSYASSLINFRGPLIRELVTKGHEVFVAGPYSGGAAELRFSLYSMGARFCEYSLARNGTNPFADLRTYFDICRLILDVYPDVTLSYTLKPIVYSGIAFRTLRLLTPWRRPRYFALITGLGYAFTSSGELSFLRKQMRRLVEHLYRAGLRPAAAVIFQNPDDQGVFRDLKLIPPTAEVHRVWGSGVDLAAFAPQPLPSRPVFLMLARLLGDKGIREYVAAARHVKQRFPRASFQLAGMLDSNPTAITQSEMDGWIRAGFIEYLGDLQQVQPALAACRFYVLPSYREGTPRSVLEALATARPVITTDAPGCRETVVHGVNGLLVPPRDANALAAAMVHLIEQPDADTERMAQASLELARERFDVRKVNAQLLAVMGA